MITKLKFADIEAAVDNFGGELISFKKGGKEYVWTGDPEYWSGRSPVLFPVVCALLDGKTRFEGKEYEIQKHGLIRKCEFETVSISDKKAIFEIRPNEEMLKKYPYKFLFTVTHTLSENGFVTEYRVKNEDGRKMPFMLGGHAGFAVSSVKNLTLDFEKGEDCPLYRTTEKGGYMDNSLVCNKKIEKGHLDFIPSDFDNDALIAKDLISRRLRFEDKKDKRAFSFFFDKFDVLGMWTPIGKDAPFICLEAWNGAPAFVDEKPDFEDKPYIRTLMPGEEYTAAYGIEIEK